LPNILEISHFANEFGIFALLLVILAIAGAYFIAKFFMSLHSKIDAASSITRQLGDKIITKEGDPVVHLTILKNIENELRELRQDTEAHVSKASSHYEDIIRLNSQETYAKCNIDRCPHLITIRNQIKDVGSLFAEFSVKAEESRNASGASLKDIQTQMNTLAAEVSAQSKQVVQLLGDVLVGRKK
jgi:hypothetical protein